MSAPSTVRRLRVGCVSYLNAKPLIHGLENDRDVDLKLAVPARLLAGLQSSEFDVALLPVIDYQRLGDARIVPVGGIGCDGPTLTVRIFSRKPIEQIQELACDSESHTSVALARIVLARRYGIRPEFRDLSPQLTGTDKTGTGAVLLIGDKVVCDEPPGMAYQLDLGEAWKQLTGMPFVFAIWITRAGVRLGDLPDRLRKARELGMANLPAIIRRDAVPRGWPADLAMKYLSEHLKFEVGERELEAVRLFHRLAREDGLIESARELDLY
jgi:chorismate dehydratase